MKKIISLMLLTALCVGITSCSKDDDKPKIQTSCTLKVGETFNLGYDGEWTSANPFIATISNDGTITANHAGNTRVLLNKYDIYSDISVIPTYTMYSKPIVEWGISRSEVIKKAGKTPDIEESNALVYYTNNNYMPLTVYQFENNKLTSSIVAGYSSQVSNVLKHLSQRYQAYSQSDNMLIYINAETPEKADLVIGVIVEGEIIEVVYIENPITTSITESTVFMNKIKAQLKSRMRL